MNTKNSTNDVKDMEKSVSFGISFIFTLFLSGGSGYLVGSEVLGLPKMHVFIINRAICLQLFF